MAGAVVTRGRGQTYSLLVAIVATVLLAGLAVPFVFGTPVDSLTASADPALDPDVLNGGDADGDGVPDAGPLDPNAPGGTAGDPAAAGLPGADPAAGGAGPVAGGPAAAAGGGGGGGGAGAPGAPGGPRLPLTASDVGVTPTTIKIGIIVPDLAALAATGFPVDPGDTEGQWRLWIKQINDRGGIQGRQVVPVIIKADVIDQNKQREACLRLTRDEKVFAVLGSTGFSGAAVLCIVEEHGTPLLDNTDQLEEWLTRRAPNRLFALPQNKTRVLKNYVAFLDRIGALKGKTIGVIHTRGYEQSAIDGGLRPAMKQFGYTIAQEYVFSDQPNEAAAQMGIAVNQMRQRGVDVVLLPLNFLYANQFAIAADGQGYRPKYYTSEYSQGTYNYYAFKMPDSFDGTLGTATRHVGEGRVGLPEPAADAACRTAYEQASGRKVDRNSTSDEIYSHVVITCGIAQLFAAAADKAGPQLTRDGFARGMKSLGPVTMPGYAGGSFSGGKNDAADFERVVVWRKDCRCWQPVQNSQFYRSPS